MERNTFDGKFLGTKNNPSKWECASHLIFSTFLELFLIDAALYSLHLISTQTEEDEKKERYWFQLLYGTGWGYMALRVSALVFEMKEANGRTTEKNAALTPSNQNCSVRHSNIWIVVVIVLANISVFGRFPFSLFHMSLFSCVAFSNLKTCKCVYNVHCTLLIVCHVSFFGLTNRWRDDVHSHGQHTIAC